MSNTQRGNPVVSCLKNVGWEYSTIPADYQMGVSTCALFLSLKYHQVHPDYLDKRIEKISGMFNLRVLLLMCDAKQYTQDVKDLTKRCLANNITIVMAWTPEQAARYLEQYKILENKGPELIKERAKDDWVGQMTSLLTSIQRVNKTDAMALLTKFGVSAEWAWAGCVRCAVAETADLRLPPCPPRHPTVASADLTGNTGRALAYTGLR